MTLPALGESVTEGTVTRWLKQVGDDVAVDEPLLEVSTDKVDTEIPSPVAGKLLEIKVAEDETVEVGAELAVDRLRRRRAGSGRGEAHRGEPAAEEKQPEAEPAAEEKQPEPRAARRSPPRRPDRRSPQPCRAGARCTRSRRLPPQHAAAARASADDQSVATSRRWSARWPPSTASTWSR